MLSAAAQAAGAQTYPLGALYVVATPIGNLADITLRAVHTLALADLVACEDTRTTGLLLQSLGLSKPMLAVHQHNEHEGAQRVVERLAQGQRVAYVSDAGTPAVSDPGSALVRAVRKAGLRCIPLPGASSALAALSVAGDVSARGFRFLGFLPTKAAARAAALREELALGCSLVLFESPHRIESLGQELAVACPQRRITLARELTKQFEEVAELRAIELSPWLADHANRRRGEFVVVVHGLTRGAEAPGAGHESAPAPEAQRVLGILLQTLPLSQAAALAAEISGHPRKALYQWALDQKADGRAPPSGS